MTGEHWDDRLRAHLRAADVPFAWGTADCFSLMMGAAQAVNGFDPYRGTTGSYDSRIGALKALSAAGFDSLEAMLAARFARVAMGRAMRGDLVLVPDAEDAGGALPLAGGVVEGGAGLVGMTDAGLTRLPLRPDYRYFAVRSARR